MACFFFLSSYLAVLLIFFFSLSLSQNFFSLSNLYSLLSYLYRFNFIFFISFFLLFCHLFLCSVKGRLQIASSLLGVLQRASRETLCSLCTSMQDPYTHTCLVYYTHIHKGLSFYESKKKKCLPA